MTQTPTSTQSPQASTCDIVVVGGGPAGATVAALLAKQGRQVVLLEKEHHPRFHIGESLLPANVRLLERLGVRDQVEAIGMPKWGIEFCSQQHQHRSFFEFAEAWDKSMPMAWQVRRSAFDEILFRHAASCGATTLEGCKVRQVAFDDEGATVDAALDDGSQRRWRARFVIDASGRDTLLANQFDLKRKNRKHNSAALFGHFTGAQRLEGRREGNISLFWFPHGWFWFIPLSDGSTSVGAVCWPYYLKSRENSVEQFFDDTIAMAPALAERLQGATLIDGKVYATGNYSYTSTRCSGERYLMIGDAYTFIDPVFSTGVYLAMNSAFEAVDVVATCLDRPAEGAAARQGFERYIRKGPREFSWFIHRMTTPTMRHLFMNPGNPMRTQEAVLSLLAGDIFGKTPIWLSLTAFKCVYYLGSLAALPRSVRAWLDHRRNVRDLGALKGENVVAPRP